VHRRDIDRKPREARTGVMDYLFTRIAFWHL
jgi:hypothetical protein